MTLAVMFIQFVGVHNLSNTLYAVLRMTISFSPLNSWDKCVFFKSTQGFHTATEQLNTRTTEINQQGILDCWFDTFLICK